MAGKLAINGGRKLREAPWPPWPAFGPEEEAALLDVLHSGVWGIPGRKKQELEKAFARYHGCRFGVAVSNGTVALHTAVLASGVEAGDEVIVPPYTFVATASAVVLANAVPVFVDIDPDTYCIDPKLIEEAITPRTRAIIPVHLGGQPAEMDTIMEIARRHDLTVIEDAAHAHGAEYKGRRVGSLGHLGCFSFQSSKNLTSGEGGIITTNDERLYELCESIHNCGRLRKGGWYDHHLLGSNYRMAEWEAAVLLCGLARLEDEVARRDANGRYLNERLGQIPGIRPLPRGHGETRHAYHLYLYRYDPEAFDGLPLARFAEAVRAEGVFTTPGYDKPLYRQPWLAEGRFGPYTGGRAGDRIPDYRQVSCPVCERACRETGWLRQQDLLGTREDMDDIVRAFEKVWENRHELLE